MRTRLPILWRILILFVILALVLTGSLYVMQRLLLPSFYYNRTVERLYDQIDELDEMIMTDDISHVFDSLVGNYQRTIAAEITIYTPSGSVLFNESSAPLTTPVLVRLSEGSLEETFYDGRMTYLQVWLKTDTYIYRFKTPYESLDTALSIINELYVIALFAALALSTGLGILFAGSVANPIRRLDRIAGRMSDLDFSVRFEEMRNDEIGRLGKTLNRLTDELQKTISLLARELEQQKNLVRLRQTFVSGVSHELQTPLAVILGTLESIEDGIVTTDIDRDTAMKQLSSEASKMSRLVTDMLDLAQLESGTFRVSHETFDYKETVHDVVATFKRLKSSGSTRLDLKDNIVSGHIKGDAGRIEQVLNNLLNNAYAHARADTAITVSVEEEASMITTRVTNIGEKVPEEMLEEIFLSFHKGSGTRKGTGLGLSIARQIVRLHGGDITVKNNPDGVTFTFVLPKRPDTGKTEPET
jgi:two-component system, OmpR family, sensor histidine kinase VanS